MAVGGPPPELPSRHRKDSLRDPSGEIRVLAVFGTRPEAVKMAPVVRLLRETPGIAARTCVTAQHREMLDQVLDVFRIEPEVDLNLMREDQDLFDLTARLISGMKEVLDRILPDFVLVHGDTTTTLAASLAAYYSRIPVGHVEAGLRTRSKFAPFPEEMNRRLTDSLADVHFAPTSRARENLLAESIPAETIHVTGNTGIDALLWTVGQVRKGSIEGASEPVDRSGFDRNVLVTCHRRESFGEGMERICLAIRELSERFPGTLFVFPVHKNPNVRLPVRRILADKENVRLTEPLAYAPFVALMAASCLILTDSGGIQEEAPSLGVPVLVLREKTERPEAIDAGTAILVGTQKANIVIEAARILEDEGIRSGMKTKSNPFGDGHASERVVNAILRFFDRRECYNPPDLRV